MGNDRITQNGFLDLDLFECPKRGQIEVQNEVLK